MNQQISDFEKARGAFEKGLHRSHALLSKQVTQLFKKKAKHRTAANSARSKKIDLIADTSKKMTVARKNRLQKLEETIDNSASESRTLNIEMQAAKAELNEIKLAIKHYKTGFAAFDKAVVAHDKTLLRKAKITAKKAAKRVTKKPVKKASKTVPKKSTKKAVPKKTVKKTSTLKKAAKRPVKRKRKVSTKK